VATAQALDGEMTERIAAHVRTRGADFRTIEEPLALPEALDAIDGADVVVVDCLTLWLSNLLGRGDAEAQVGERVEALCAALGRRRFHALVITNEVGLGIVPEAPLGRLFRDVAGARTSGWRPSRRDSPGDPGTVLRLRPSRWRSRRPSRPKPKPKPKPTAKPGDLR